MVVCKEGGTYDVPFESGYRGEILADLSENSSVNEVKGCFDSRNKGRKFR